MANGDYNVEQLVADVRRRAMIPNSTTVLSNDDITAFLNDEMWEYIVPMLMATTEEYLVHATEPWTPSTTTIDLEDSGTGGRFPGGVVGLKIRDVQIQSVNSWISLPRIEPEYESQFVATGATQGYMFRGSKLHLIPVNEPVGAQIRVLYYKRPEALVYASPYTKPSIPQDLCPLLVQRAVYRCLDALGDSRAEAAAAAAERTRVTCIQLISPRGEGSPRVVINYNGPGWTYRRRPYYMR
jgi:hypothetical protein